MKKKYFTLLLGLFMCSCGMFTKGSNEAVYPVNSNGVNVSYVKLKSGHDFNSIYRISDVDRPLWCGIDEVYHRYIQSLAIELSDNGVDSKPVYVACYSGQKPVFVDAPPISDTVKIKKGTFFSYHSTRDFYIAAAKVVTSCPQTMPVFYFSLYSELCSGTEVKCCMNGDGTSFTIYAMFDSSLDAKNDDNIQSFFNYINNPVFSRNIQNNSYNLFVSFIQDRCSFNRWYHGAVYMGISSPETFVDKQKWDEYFNSLKSCSFEIKETATLVVGQKI